MATSSCIVYVYMYMYIKLYNSFTNQADRNDELYRAGNVKHPITSFPIELKTRLQHVVSLILNPAIIKRVIYIHTFLIYTFQKH